MSLILCFVAIMTTRTHANENQPLEFQPIAIALARVVRRLTEKQHGETDRESEPTGKTEQKSDAHREFVAQRRRELAAFERRVSGVKDRS